MSDAALAHIAESEARTQDVEGIGPEVVARSLARVGVVGAGTMGDGIAMNFLNVGLAVTIVDCEGPPLERGTPVIRNNYARSAAREKLTAERVEARLGLLAPRTIAAIACSTVERCP